MPRYADPALCPDCRFVLPANPTTCPHCALPLRGPTAASLFGTLQSADAILARLRASSVPAAASPGPDPVPPPAPADPAEWRPERYPAPAAVPAPRTGLSAASVPKILLGLGALCLLVAAVTFLAVAWSWLGVGGRTAVLVALTLVAGGLGTWLGGRGLRVGAESLTVVALGLLTLDVVGADDAGWMGNLGSAGLGCVVGGSLLVASLTLLLPPARLVTPQLVATAGLGLLVAGASALTRHDQVVAAVAVLAFAALLQAGRSLRAVVLPWAAGIGAAAWWASLAPSGFLEAAHHASIRGLWGDGHGWPLLTAAVLLMLPVAFARSSERLTSACGAATASLVSLAVAMPGLDEDFDTFAVVALALVGFWAAATVVVPARWGLVPRVPLELAAFPVLGITTLLLLDGTARVLRVGDPFTRDAGVHLLRTTTIVHPALLVPCLVALLVTAALLVPGRRLATAARLPRSVPAAALLLAGAATLALIPAPLWTVVGGLVLTGAVLLADALRRTDSTGTVLAATGALVLAAGVLAALPSAVLTTAAVAVLVLGAAGTELAGRFPLAHPLGGALLPAAAAGLLWSACHVTGVEETYRAAPVLLVVGLLAILRPRLEVEASAALAAVAATLPALSAAPDFDTALALHLTLAGALVSASALVTPSRRPLGWLGGLLLAAATWVRLADLGVEAPEAYTLPSAVALLLVGLRRLYDDPGASSVLALAPGLTLATTPSLLWVVAGDPVSLRAALLGTGCLALVLLGTRLGWSAPLVVGSAVGGLLVLVELAPYASATPQWVLIGLAGTLLTVVGVTWERRLHDVQVGMAYLGRLR